MWCDSRSGSSPTFTISIDFPRRPQVAISQNLFLQIIIRHESENIEQTQQQGISVVKTVLSPLNIQRCFHARLHVQFVRFNANLFTFAASSRRSVELETWQ